MVQKLFRLTSQSNNGIFDTLFNEDIAIPADSSIALQSVAFDRQSTELIVNADNKDIEYGLLNPDVISSGTSKITNWKAKIPFGTYAQVTEGETLMGKITDRMNAVTNMNLETKNVTDGGTGHRYSINKGAQWRMNLNANGKARIQCRTQAACQISRDSWSKTQAAIDTTVYAGEGLTPAPPVITAAQDAGGGLGTLDSIARPQVAGATGDANDFNSSYVWGKIRMNKGTGCIRARVAQLLSETDNVNFTLGLVLDKTVLEKGTIALNNIHYAIRCNGSVAPYSSKVGTAGLFKPCTEKVSGNNCVPVQFQRKNEASNPNDVLEIRIEGTPAASGTSNTIPARTQINMDVRQQGGLISVNEDGVPPLVDQSQDWYYFISFHHSVAICSIDMVEADLDSYAFAQNPQPSQLPNFPVQLSTLDTVVRPGWSSIRAAEPKIPFTDRSAQFQFSGVGVSSFFHYPTNILPTIPALPLILPVQSTNPGLKQSGDYSMIAPKRAEFSVTSKNFIVLFDNLPVNSYDTYSRFDVAARNANSGGSRRDIIATIPIKEDIVAGTSITRVAYEPNTLNFVDLFNRNDMITRSLRCRILTSTYEPIEVDGMASLTLLMKDKSDLSL